MTRARHAPATLLGSFPNTRFNIDSLIKFLKMMSIAFFTILIFALLASSCDCNNAQTEDEYSWSCQAIVESQISGNDAWIKDHKMQDGEDTWQCEEVVDQMYKQTSSESLTLSSSLTNSSSELISKSTKEKASFVPSSSTVSVTDTVNSSDPLLNGYEQVSLITSLVFVGLIAII
jgi:hypothetical protein